MEEKEDIYYVEIPDNKRFKGETKQLTFLLTNMLRCDKIYL